VTPRQLSEIGKRFLGRTAKRMIEERLVLEAKRLLRFTDRPVKRVAYDLGYDDPSHFSKVFKRLTDQAPQDFKNQHAHSSGPGQEPGET